MKIYLAAPIFNPMQLIVVGRLKEYAEGLEHEVFSPYHNSQDIWRGRAPKDCSAEERARVLDDNIRYLDWCDMVLAWVGGNEGGFTDPGVVWELGYSRKAEKFQLAYIDPTDVRQSMNLMLAGTIDAVCKGGEVAVALMQLAQGTPMAEVAATYSPDNHLAHEKEPIV